MQRTDQDPRICKVLNCDLRDMKLTILSGIILVSLLVGIVLFLKGKNEDK